MMFLKVVSLFVKPAALEPCEAVVDAAGYKAAKTMYLADDKVYNSTLYFSLSASAQHTQGYIHMCEAIHMGRNMIESSSPDGNLEEPLTNIEDSAIPYVKTLIENKMLEEWSAKLKEISTGSDLVFPSPTIKSATVGKEIDMVNSFGPLQGLNGKVTMVDNLENLHDLQVNNEKQENPQVVADNLIHPMTI